MKPKDPSGERPRGVFLFPAACTTGQTHYRDPLPDFWSFAELPKVSPRVGHSVHINEFIEVEQGPAEFSEASFG